MIVSLDVLLGTLIFVLPGFIAVGSYVALGKFYSRPDLTRGTFVLMALTFSVPLLLLFNAGATKSPYSLLVPIGVPELKSAYSAPQFLFSLSLLYALSSILGSLVAISFNVGNTFRRKHRGICHSVNKLNVWTKTIGSRKQTPFVIVVLEKSAYHGQLRRATTDEDDSYIFVTKPDFMPLDGNQRPDWPKRTKLNIDGILLQKSDIKAFWIVS